MKPGLLLVFIEVLGAMAAPTPSYAQQPPEPTPAIEVGAAGFLYFPKELGNSNFPAAGMGASLVANFSNRMALVGEAVAYRIRKDNNPYSFVAGPRVFVRRSFRLPRGRGTSAIGIFAQTLAGAVVGGHHPRQLVVQPGGGITLGRSVRFTYEWDYVFIGGDEGDRSGLRNLLGVAVGIGSVKP